MSTWFVEFTFELSPSLSEEMFGVHFESVLEALDEMDGISDADGTIEWSDHRVHVHTAAQGSDQLDVMAKTITSLRTAIHVAGGSTPGWELLVAEMLHNPQVAVHADSELV